MIEKMSTLIFIYNADGGWLNAVADGVHKLARPASYPCSLCALTYGAVAKRPEWRAFLGRIGMSQLFVYRDEFREDLDTRDLPLPAILLAGEGPVPEVLVSAAELAGLADLDGLIALIEARAAGFSR